MKDDEIIKSIITSAGTSHDSGRWLLLQYLCQIQQQLSYIPADAITQLAGLTQLPESEIHGVIEF